MKCDHQRLLLILAAFGLAMTLGATAPVAEELKIGGTGTSIGTMKLLGEAFTKAHPGIQLEIPQSLGSTGGIKAVSAGAIDIAMTSRPMKDAEKQAGVVELPYATTAFIFVTALQTATDLSRQDVIDIYNGRKAAWPDGQAIRILLRPESDSDSTFLTKFFPEAADGIAALRSAQLVPVETTDQDNLDAAEKLPGSFAAASLCTVLSEGRRLTILSLAGVAPSVDTLASGAYPLSRTLYFVTKPERSAAVQAFIDFVLSDDGGRVLAAAGNLPIKTKD